MAMINDLKKWAQWSSCDRFSYLLRTLLEFLVALLLSAWLAVYGFIIEARVPSSSFSFIFSFPYSPFFLFAVYAFIIDASVGCDDPSETHCGEYVGDVLWSNKLMRWSWLIIGIHRTIVWSTAMFILLCMSVLEFPPSSTCECLSQPLPIFHHPL